MAPQRASAAVRASLDASPWPPLLTIARAVAYAGCSRSTINRAISGGELPLHGRIGKHGHLRVVRREDLDRWLAGDDRARGAGR
jgi:excisionase family DNA binding protein